MNAKPKDTVIANARIVLADRVIEQGWLALANGRIAEIGEGRAPAGDVDALLLTTGEGRWRKLPEPLGDVEAMQELAGARLRVGARHAVDDQRLGDDVDGRNPRHRTQKLADIADGGAADI